MIISAAEYREQVGKPKKAKYGNKRVVVDGMKFDSVAESNRYFTLALWERQGVIYGLRRQVTYELTGADGAVVCRYRSDFDYFDTSSGMPVTEDVKGVLTAAFKLKAKLFKQQYGREIKVIK